MRNLRRIAAAVLVAVLSVGISGTLRAEPAQLIQQLRVAELFEVLREEGVVYGLELQAELFSGLGGPSWMAELDAIHDPARLMPLFETHFAAALSTADTAPMVAFFDAPLGAKVIALELSARAALLDDAVLEMAMAALEAAQVSTSPRLAMIEAFIEDADLIEPNVVSSLNANYAFYSAMVAGDGFPYEMSEADILVEIYRQEAEVYAEMIQWLTAYLLLAYGPLSDGELADYIVFSLSEPGLRLSRALFAGFDPVFSDVSRSLGAAAAIRMRGQAL